MSYFSYINTIKNALMLLGVKEGIAKKKAECCRGFYTNDRKYVPVAQAIDFCTSRIALSEFSVEGLKEIRERKTSRTEEIKDFLSTCFGNVMYE